MATVRIAYVTETYPPEINGVALTAERTVRHLRSAGHQVQLLRPRQSRETAPRDSGEWLSAGLPIPMYPDLRCGLARAATLRRLWRAGGTPELVHVTTPGPLAWAALRAARSEGLPCSADFRTNFHAYSHHYGLGWCAPWVLAGLRRLHALADGNFVPTHELARSLAGHGFERLQVAGRGVDAERFSPTWRDPLLRLEWQATWQSRVLLYVGRLAAEKNVALALRTFERLKQRHDELQMVVVGDGPQRLALERAHPAVHFVGTKRGAELSRHYASADVFLFPSLTDTFGNVTLEALASGLAVVAFDTAAAAQHIEDGVSGCLARPLPATGAEAAFSAAVERVLLASEADSVLRIRARESGQRAAWEPVLRGFEQSLLGIAAAHRLRAPRAAMA